MPDLSCESCQSAPAALEVANVSDAGRPFRVCLDCDRRLQALALRPLEWFRLAALHGWGSYLLCDEFYDDDGRACAAREEVVGADALPYPLEDSWSSSIALALDVAYTKWALPPSLVGVFAAAPEATLECIRSTLATRASPHFRARAYEIAAMSLGARAESWVRDQWAVPELASLFSLAQASAICLPVPEGLRHVVDVVAALPANQRHEHIAALSWFRGPEALDALEGLVHPPLTESWGRVAASCGLDWARARTWFDGGRPLSLVALDALHAFLRYDTVLLRITKPKLIGAPGVGEVEDCLARVAERDPVPRVKRTVGFVLANIDALISGKSLMH